MLPSENKQKGQQLMENLDKQHWAASSQLSVADQDSLSITDILFITYYRFQMS